MAIEYKVWLEIEEYDTETGNGKNMDAPGSSLATFENYDAAYGYAMDVTNQTFTAEKVLQDIMKWWQETPAFQEGNDEMPAELFDRAMSIVRATTST